MEPIVVRAKELARLLGVSIVTIRRMDSAGKVPAPIRLGGCVAWRLDEIRSWVEAGSPGREKWQALQAALRRGGK